MKEFGPWRANSPVAGYFRASRTPAGKGEDGAMRSRITGFVFVALFALVATACGAGDEATHFKLANKNSQPAGITTGPDGHVWFTQFAGGRIARISSTG